MYTYRVSTPTSPLSGASGRAGQVSRFGTRTLRGGHVDFLGGLDVVEFLLVEGRGLLRGLLHGDVCEKRRGVKAGLRIERQWS